MSVPPTLHICLSGLFLPQGQPTNFNLSEMAPITDSEMLNQPTEHPCLTELISKTYFHLIESLFGYNRTAPGKEVQLLLKYTFYITYLHMSGHIRESLMQLQLMHLCYPKYGHIISMVACFHLLAAQYCILGTL